MPSTPVRAIERPSLQLLGTEPWRAAMEFVSHLRHDKPARPIGDGHPVVIFPGLAADGTTVAPLRKYCQALGYTAFDWGEGRNTGPQGDIDAWLAALAKRMSKSLSGCKRPANPS